MKIEIKLENPKSCEGCPCLDYETLTSNINYTCNKIYEGIYCILKRPQKCIDENGE